MDGSWLGRWKVEGRLEGWKVDGGIKEWRVEILMKAGADPSILAAFTMRDPTVDTASAMLQTVFKGKTAILNYCLTMHTCQNDAGLPGQT